jgi:hypothetical protein
MNTDEHGFVVPLDVLTAPRQETKKRRNEGVSKRKQKTENRLAPVRQPDT